MKVAEIIEAAFRNHEEGGWRYFPRRYGGRGNYDIWDAKEDRWVTHPQGIDPKEKLEGGDAR